MGGRSGSELTGLTGLRGIAAITVFIAHARYYELIPSLRSLLIFFEWHSLAVDLFFILSGFVLVHVYAPKFASQSSGLWPSYFAARFARIFPLYLATLLACLGVFAAGSFVVGKWPSHVTWQIVLTNLFLVQGWPGLFEMSLNIPSWSLSVEFFCYVAIMPVALVLHRVLNRTVSLLAIVFLIVFWRIGFASVDSGWIGLLRGITGFLAGALLHKAHLSTSSRIAGVVTIISAGLFLLFQSLVAWRGAINYLPVFTFPCLILGLASSARNVVQRFFESPVVLWLGDLSYSVYLWHGPIFLVTHTVIRPLLLNLPLAVRIAWIVLEVAFTLFLSHLSFHRFETPARRWLRR